ncbi:hypothetical protein BC831DRAFT_477918 [Entophlyctis helioformis]|nr:hypothetical protein BC831DRAFT_477918 [Entophlyctis helioformis]
MLRPQPRRLLLLLLPTHRQHPSLTDPTTCIQPRSASSRTTARQPMWLVCTRSSTTRTEPPALHCTAQRPHTPTCTDTPCANNRPLVL